MDAPPSRVELDEDYFQTWKDKMKARRADVGAGDSEIGIVRPCSPASSLRLRNDIAGSLEGKVNGQVDLSSEPGSVSGSLSIESKGASTMLSGTYYNSRNVIFAAPQSESFEVEFQPSGNRVKCQHIELDGPISEFQPTDGVQLDLRRKTEHIALSVLKFPFERGATAVSLVSQPPNQKAIDGSSQQSWILYFTKRIMWARRLGLPTHRFVYLVVRDSGASQSGAGGFHPTSASGHSTQHLGNTNSTNNHRVSRW
jgi:hypothetical protein